MRQRQLVEPTIVVRGAVPDRMVAYARDKLLGVVAHAPAPVLHAELRLDQHADAARERPHHIAMTIDLDGRPVRAHRSAETMSEAVDRAAERLRRRLERIAELPQSEQLRHRDESWHHGDRREQRPSRYPRPPEERELVRRKTFALRPESLAEALFDLEALDHDFFLFVHDETGAEAVVYRADGGYGVCQRVPTPAAVDELGIPVELGPSPATTTLEEALAVLDETDASFEFFIDAGSGRAAVVYQRYDGHYGMIVTQEER
jgi:ribosome-associated translation inhibitor RaiA